MSQLGRYSQLHTLFLADGATQFPEYSLKTQILSTNVEQCVKTRGEQKPDAAWWQVCIHAAEVFRYTASNEQADVLRPLSQGEIRNAVNKPVTAVPAPAGTSVTEPSPILSALYSSLKARITFTDRTAIQRQFDVDIGGGTTLSFFGDHVGVDILYPDPGIIIPPAAGLAVLEGLAGTLPEGQVLDTWIQASAGVCPAPIGREAARYTVTRILTAEEEFLFKIPPAAVNVSIHVDPVAAIAGDTFQWVASPLLGNLVPVGAIDPTLVSSGGKAPVPGTARWLVVTPAADQTASLVFELEY